ncbi:MAG: exopolysaccharide Pel transporter PelG [Planctomycetota bacterium]|jgi:uncharacterized membrane protein|nr:exopolysaccharide Pel transporter PelG [Planctomycetota bacterium]
MAGIGFRLQKLLNSGSYQGLLLGYAYSAIISSGPWMLAMFGIAAIGVVARMDIGGGVDKQGGDLFRAVVTYVYAGSLLFGGFSHLGISRYISDRLYSGQMERVLPCFMRTAAATLIVGLIVSALWFYPSGLSIVQATAGIALYQGLSLVWLCMVFLSAAKGYDTIAWGFFLCNVLGFVLALFGNRFFGLDGLMWGYATGQMALGGWLSLRIYREFPSYAPEEGEVFPFLWGKRALIGVGFLFNFGVWVDKFVIWYSPIGKQLSGWFHCSDIYDTCLYVSYLTVLPAMTMFLIRIETSFYKNYSIYFNAVTCGGDYEAIKLGKKKIGESLELSAARIVKFQGGLSLSLILAAPLLAPYIGIPPDAVPLLRFGFLAALAQAMLQFLLIFFLYFDWQTKALKLAIFFVATNAIFTVLTIIFARDWLGLGYLAACVSSLVFGVFMFNRGMVLLEFETFAKQVGEN